MNVFSVLAVEKERPIRYIFRIRYNPREGNDLYLVYNEGLNTDRFRERPVLPTTGTRTVLLKYSYTFVL